MSPSHTIWFIKGFALASVGFQLGCAKYVPASAPIIRFSETIPSLKLAIRPLGSSRYQEVNSVTISWGDGENRRVGKKIENRVSWFFDGKRIENSVFEFVKVPILDCDVWIEMKKQEGDAFPPHWHFKAKFKQKDLDERGIVVLQQFPENRFCEESHCPMIYSERVHWWNKKWWRATPGA